jgi:DNA-binding NtrC family response regulator
VPHREPPTVIVIDDDATILSCAVRALKTLPITVRATSCAYEALDWLATRDIAVIVSDYEMPKMNGVELMSAARHSQPKAVRILMTGRQALETAVEAINRGEIFRYVQKPFDATQMRAVVSDAVTRHRELALIADEAKQALRRESFYQELEGEHPGISATLRDEDGDYVVPDVCNALAVRMLGLDLSRST